MGDLVELFGDEAGDDVGAEGGVVAAIVEEADREREQVVAGDAVQLRAVGGQVLVAGGNGGDIDQDQAGAGGVLAAVRVDEGAGVVAELGTGGSGGWTAGGARGRGGREEAIMDRNQVFFWAEMGEVEPDVLNAVEGAKAGGVAGEGNGFLWVLDEGAAGLMGATVAEEFEQAFGVDGLSPDAVLGLEAVRAELNQENARLRVVLEVVVEGEVVGDGQDGVGDGNVAGFEAGVALDDIGIDAGHSGGVAEDEDVADAIAHVEDCVVGAHPDAGAVVQEKIGPAEGYEEGDREKRKEDERDAVVLGGSAGAAAGMFLVAGGRGGGLMAGRVSGLCCWACGMFRGYDSVWTRSWEESCHCGDCIRSGFAGAHVSIMPDGEMEGTVTYPGAS